LSRLDGTTELSPEQMNARVERRHVPVSPEHSQIARLMCLVEALEADLAQTRAHVARLAERVAAVAEQMPKSFFLVYVREKGRAEWLNPFQFTSEAAARDCYRAWAFDGIHEAKMETRQRDPPSEEQAE